MKKVIFGIVFALSLLLIPAEARAAGCTIQFTTANSEVKKGEMFTVVCQVTSSTPFLDAEFKINFDSGLLQFVVIIDGFVEEVVTFERVIVAPVSPRVDDIRIADVLRGNTCLGVAVAIGLPCQEVPVNPLEAASYSQPTAG